MKKQTQGRRDPLMLNIDNNNDISTQINKEEYDRKNKNDKIDDNLILME